MPDIPKGYWPCACVRRDKGGVLKAIKIHHSSRAKCRTCGAKRPPEVKGQ